MSARPYYFSVFFSLSKAALALGLFLVCYSSVSAATSRLWLDDGSFLDTSFVVPSEAVKCVEAPSNLAYLNGLGPNDLGAGEQFAFFTHLEDATDSLWSSSVPWQELQNGTINLCDTVLYYALHLNGCPLLTDSVMFSCFDEPEITFSSLSVCEGGAVDVSLTSGDDSDWSVSFTDGIMVDAENGASATYTPLAGDSITLTLATTIVDGNGCTSSSSDILRIYPTPQLDLPSNPLEICMTNANSIPIEYVDPSYLLDFPYQWSLTNTATQSNVSFSFVSNNLNIIDAMSLDSIRNYLLNIELSTNSVCAPVSDSVFITVFPPIDNNLPASLDLCIADEVVFDVSGIDPIYSTPSYLTWSFEGDASASVTGNSVVISDFINPNLSQTALLSLVANGAGNCPSDSSSIALQFNPPPQSDFDALELSLCASAGESFGLLDFSPFFYEDISFYSDNSYTDELDGTVINVSNEELVLGPNSSAIDSVAFSTFFIELTGVAPCEAFRDSLTVRFNPDPRFEVDNPSLCDNEDLELINILYTDSLTIELSDQDPTIYSSLSGSLTVPFGLFVESEDSSLDLTLVSDQGCTITETIDLNIFASPVLTNESIIISAEEDEGTICLDRDSVFNLSAPMQYDYVWDTSNLFSSQVEDNVLYIDSLVEMTNFIIPVTAFATYPDITCVTSLDYLFEIESIANTCKIEDVYAFPDGVYIAELREGITGEEYFLWMDSEGNVLEDDFNEIFVFPQDLDPSEISLQASLYPPETLGEGYSLLCECRLDFEGNNIVGGSIVEVKSFPNPLENGNLNLILPSYFQDQVVSVELVDMKGSLVWQSKREADELYFSLAVPEHLSGTYMLVVTSESHFAQQKLIIR